MDSLKRSYKRIAITVLSAVLVLSGFFAWQTSKVGFSYDFEQFFPDNEEVDAYLSYKDSFLTETEPIWIGIPFEQSIFSDNNLQKIRDLDRTLRTDSAIVGVQSITSLKIPISTGIGIIFDRYVHPGQHDMRESDSLKVLNSPLVMRSFVSTDFKNASILVQTRYDLDKEESIELGKRIEEKISKAGIEAYHLVGRLIDQSVIVDKLLGEMVLFLSLAAIIVCLALAFFYRNFWAVFVPLMVVSLAAVWLLGSMTLFGKDIDVLMTLVPTILFIVGVSDIIHFLTRYLEVLKDGESKLMAIRKSFREIGLATLITSLTTAIGFLSLLTSNIGPVRSFGLFTALGVIIAYILAFSLFPAILILLPKEILDRTSGITNNPTPMRKFFYWNIRNRKWIVPLVLLLTIASALTVPRMISNTYLTEELPSNDPIKDAFDYMERHFAGVRNMEVALSTKGDRQLTEPALIQQIAELENFLEMEYGAGSLVSPATNYKLSNQISSGGAPNAFRVPETKLEWSLSRPFYRKISNRKERRFVLNSDNTVGRITGQMPDIGGYKFLKITERFNKEVATLAPDITVQMTGLPYLLDVNNEQVSQSLIKGIGLAFLVVSLLMALLYRDVRMVFIALIPNVLPLLFVGLIMVISNIHLNLTTSLLFTVIFGIAVDDTIHVLSKMKVEMNKGVGHIRAVRRSMISTGKALVLTSIILALGFFVLVFSDFSSSFYFGTLVSAGLFFALIVDLTILPLLLIFARKR